MRGVRTLTANLLVLLLFTILSIAMLWPLPKHMSDTLISEVDPLLNTWIFAWDIHQLFTDPFHLFDANIFFPLENTLAFSEHMIVLSLIAMPVVLVSGNPILGYNFVQLLSFILCGFAAYLLVFHLTRNKTAAFFAGFIFAFHPFRFRQIGHIQNISVFWTPLCLLHLHKFLKRPVWKYALLFALFFVFQALSCGYMGVFLSLLVGAAVLYYLLFTPKKEILPVLKKFVMVSLLAALVIAPFLYPYLQVEKEHEFKRTVENNIRISANIMSYATLSRLKQDIPYYPISQKVRYTLHREREEILRPLGKGLFPGVITLILVVFAFALPFSHGKRAPDLRFRREHIIYRTARKVCLIAILVCTILAFFIVVYRVKGISLLGIDFRSVQLTLPVYLILLFFLIWLVLSRFSVGGFEDGKKRFLIHRNFYLSIAVFSFFLSFGPKIYYLYYDLGEGPYMFLFEHVVFFKGIRAPERFGILLMLGLSVLAGFGMFRLMKLLKKRAQTVFGLIVSGLLVYEFICVPLPFFQIPREPDAVYKWLASDREQYGILEYPLETLQQDKYYMYWSTFHWKKLANGSSGFNPERTGRLRRLAHEKKTFPNPEFIHYLKTLVPVKYLILHLGETESGEKEAILATASQFSEDLRLVKVFDNSDFVFEVIY